MSLYIKISQPLSVGESQNRIKCKFGSLPYLLLRNTVLYEYSTPFLDEPSEYAIRINFIVN